MSSLRHRIISIAASCVLLASRVTAGDTTNTALIPTPTAQVTGLRSLNYQGCFSDTAPLIWHGPWTYQSSGNCQQICWLLGNTVLGLGNGTDCWCGDKLPPKNSKVADTQCNTPCSGYGQNFCGSGSDINVYLTGYSLNAVPNYDPSSAKTSSLSNVATASANVSPSSAPKSSSNTGGIVAGVIVAIVVVAAIFGGVFFYFRRRRQHQEIDDLKHQTSVSAFVSGGEAAPVSENRPQMWAPDTRLDGSTANQRLSSGSIADNQDYSRRILQVRNPDGFD